MGDFDPLDPVRNAEIIARRAELYHRHQEAWAVARPDHISFSSIDFVHPDTGRHTFEAEPDLIALGRYLRRARRYSGKSQARVALDANVSQSMVSRVERGVAPGMPLEKFVAVVKALGRLFPLGACPHGHECAWQLIRPPQRDKEAAERFVGVATPSARRGGSAGNRC
jgi:transcriptional regulator with XRE-family HTH domain